MTDAEFKTLWDTILAIARMASVIDPDEVHTLLETAKRADSIGPILYPTEYRNGGGDNVEEQRVLAKGFLAFREAIDQVKTEALRRKSSAE